MKLWKIIGLAGLAGVAATGVVVARAERRRAQLTPDEVRARLHQRLAEADTQVTVPVRSAEASPRHRHRRRFRR